MKIPLSWLKDYVDIKEGAQELAHKITMAGLEIENIEKVDSDFVFEAEVTTNRPDWLSILGVAREVSALAGKKFKAPKSAVGGPAFGGKQRSKSEKIKISIEDKQGCKRYVGWVIEDVKVGPSPNWLVDKLAKVGVRTVNNVVDITNFVLFEYGQPLHAFDYDKLQGKKIIVRKAAQGEEIITIDGEKRKLDPQKLVIADEKGPVALAGIMGGLNTEVTGTTKNILLESAYFDPPTIRRGSRSLGISTDSSYRFERNVDYETVYTAALRAAYLLEEIAGAKIKEKPVDVRLKKITERKILLSPQSVDKILGARIPAGTMKSILVNLGFIVKSKAKAFEVIPPSFRNDINIQEDLVEEIARIYQYDKIPVAMPKPPLEIQSPKTALRLLEDKTRDIIISLGMDEIISYSLLSKDLLGVFSLLNEETVELKNPLSMEQAVMRNSLIPGMLTTVSYNLNRKNLDLRLFELSKVYKKIGPTKPYEEINLCMALAGNRCDDWQNKKKTVDFYDLKGIVEVLFEKLGIKDYKFSPTTNSIFSKGACALVVIGKQAVGVIGKIDSGIQRKLDIPQEVFACELEFEKIYFYTDLEKKYRPIPKQQPVLRDISMLVSEDVAADKIKDIVTKAGKGLVLSIRIFDEYHGEKIPAGQKSLAFTIEYFDENKALTDKEINSAHSEICAALSGELKAQIR